MIGSTLGEADKKVQEEMYAEMVRMSHDIISLLGANKVPPHIGVGALAITLGGGIGMPVDKGWMSREDGLHQQRTAFDIIREITKLDERV